MFAIRGPWGKACCTACGRDEGLAKGGSLLKWLSAADSRASRVGHAGGQDTATWRSGPNCHCWFLQSRLTRAQRISVSLLSQQKRPAQLSFCSVSQLQSRRQSDEGLLETCVAFRAVWFIDQPVEGFQLVSVKWCEPDLGDGAVND